MRLIRWPVGLQWQTMTPSGGPVTVGGTQGVTGKAQTVESPYGLVGLDFTFAPLRGQMARRFRGLVTGLHGGANAVRVKIVDPDGPSLTELGMNVTDGDVASGQTWGNGQRWGNGRNWRLSPPKVPVALVAVKGSTEVTLDVARWGGAVLAGTLFGFVDHFGLYTVKRARFSGSQATLQIWPPLRKALITSDRATLRPVIAMRLVSADAGQFSRGVTDMEGAALSLIEVPDEVVRDYFQSDWET